MRVHKFRTGDEVICIDDCGAIGIQKGNHYTIDHVEEGQVFLVGMDCAYLSWRFELAETKQEKEFCTKTNRWYIRVDNKEEFEVAKEFLRSKGFSFDVRFSFYDSKYQFLVKHSNKPNVFIQTNLLTSEEKEIKLTYKNTLSLEKVEYPEVKSSQQIEIEKIEEEMRNLADRLNKLKGV